MFYFLCPYFKTGGPENTHLIASTINRMCNRIIAKVIYVTAHPGNTLLYPEIPFLECGSVADIDDIPTNFIIIPEIYPVSRVRDLIKCYNCRYVIWWQSFVNACKQYALSNLDIADAIHAFHSYYEYAMVRPHLTQNQRFIFLTDFLADEYTNIDMSQFIHEKQPIVCFNGHKDHTTQKICQDANIPYIKIQDMDRTAVNDVLRKCQIYVDMGSHPGKDHMPREAAMYGCVVITNKSGSAAYPEDVPIQEKVVHEANLPALIHDVFKDYQSFLLKQNHYREVIQAEKTIAEDNVVQFLKLHNEIVSIYEGIVLVPAHEYRKVITDHEYILKRLEEICIEAVGSPVVEGNCFCEHRNIRNRLEELIPKQMNLFSLGINASNLLEIGFNAGHSALLFLLANNHSKLVCFDICEHPYTIKCYEYLKTIFGNRLELIQGDSTITIPEYRTQNPDAMFDVFHLDGSHDLRIANLDFENGYDIVKDVIIFDDTDDEGLNKLLNGFIDAGRVDEVPLRKTTKYEYRIVRKRRTW